MGAPIVNGTPALGDAAVVALVTTSCDSFDVVCSGVLVAPRLVMTAAHCVTRARPGSLEVFHGSDASSEGTFLAVTAIRTHSGYDETTGERDVALLFLGEPSPVAPYSLPTASVAELSTGATLRAVGFGVTSRDAQDAGVKREGTLSLAAIREGSFDASPSPSLSCDKDSGGPVFATFAAGEQLVGVTTRGDIGCTATAFQVRADAVLADFVVPAIDESNAAPIETSLDGDCTMPPDPPPSDGCAVSHDGDLSPLLVIFVVAAMLRSGSCVCSCCALRARARCRSTRRSSR